MRLIGLDLGTKKCGVATTDPMKILAQPLTTIFYDCQNYTFLIEEIKKIIEDKKPVEKIILGMPLNTNGSESPMSKIVLKFKKMLEEATNLEVFLMEEKYTSKQSKEVMQQMNLSNKQKKEARDQIAAQKILENYLIYYENY